MTTLASLLFFAFFLAFWAGMHVLVARRLIRQGTRYPTWANRMIVGGVVMLAVFPLLGFFGRRLGVDMADASVLSWIGYTLMGVSTLLIAFTLIVESTRLVARGWLVVRRKLRPESTPASEAPTQPQRRAFFADVVNYGIVGGAVGLSGIGMAEARRVPRVVEVDVPVAGLHPDLDGLRIVQLSDVHIGPTIRGTWLDKVVEVVNGLDADVVALTGDFVDGFVDDLVPEMGALGRIRAKHGSFFVTGNHEYYWDGPAWCRAIAELGPRSLVNEHVVIERGAAKLLVAGVADLHADRYVPAHASDPGKAREGAPAVDFSLLLAHQPRSVFAASLAGYDLQLSGHTHAGQYFPMSVLIHLMQPYVSGLNRHEDMQIYVSRGTGYWGPPNRAGSPSEITALTLRAV
ncbi:metallophosphoesterase [Nannocystaceae bacterium ST9]